MKLWIVAVVMTLAVLASARGGELRKSGNCTLQEDDFAFDETKVFKVTLENDELKVQAGFRGGKFFKDFSVFAVPRISNKSGKPLSVMYHVAFFDKNGDLLVCASQDCNLEANTRDMQLASCSPKLPRAAFAQIASYKIVIYTEQGKQGERRLPQPPF